MLVHDDCQTSCFNYAIWMTVKEIRINYVNELIVLQFNLIQNNTIQPISQGSLGFKYTLCLFQPNTGLRVKAEFCPLPS